MATHQMYALVQEVGGTSTKLVFGNFTGRKTGEPCSRFDDAGHATAWTITKIFSPEEQILLDELASKYEFSRIAALFDHQ